MDFIFIRRLISFIIPEKLLAWLIRTRFLYFFFKKLPQNPEQFPPKSYRITKRFNSILKLDLHDYTSWHTFFGFRDSTLEYFKRELKYGNVVIDVGGNIGIMGLFARNIIGTTGKVYAFEPNYEIRQNYLDNVALNKYNNVFVYPFALGEKKSKNKLHVIDETNSGMSTIAVDENTTVYNTMQIDIVQLDSFFESENIKKVDFIKIDVEGYELEVLKGAVKTIEKYKPILLIEIDDKLLQRNQTNPSHIFSFLQEMEYSFVYFNDENYVPINNFSNLPPHFDVLAKYKVK